MCIDEVASNFKLTASSESHTLLIAKAMESFLRQYQNQTKRWLTSDFVCPHAFQIFSILVLLSSDCSTRRHRSVIIYWCSALDDNPTADVVVAVATVDDDGAAAAVAGANNESAGSPLIPSFCSSASTSCAQVVSPVIPDIQRCSPCTQIGISSSEPIDSDSSSLISSVDATDIDAIDPNDELDDDVDDGDSVRRIACSVLWLRHWDRLLLCSFL